MDQDEPALPSPAFAKHQSPPKPIYNAFDSGYHGSQQDDATQVTQANEPSHYAPRVSPTRPSPIESPAASEADDEDENVVVLGRDSEERRTTEDSFESAKEEQTRNAAEMPTAEIVVEVEQDENRVDGLSERIVYPVLESPLLPRNPPPRSPQKHSPQKSSPVRHAPLKQSPTKLSSTRELQPESNAVEHQTYEEDVQMEDVHSPSDGSSPIRPIVRKSSLNFASLPAREPLTNKKSIGNRVSRTSQLEQSRTSYYGRQTGGKSLGNAKNDDEDDDEDEMDVDETGHDDTDTKMSRLHNKTSTQRLQDQISMLGQSQSHARPSKSIASTVVSQPYASQNSQAANSQPQRQKSPERKSRLPGAFPDDEEDSWIGPPPPQKVAAAEPNIFSPRPEINRGHTTDVMEQIHGKESVAGAQFNIPKRGSPVREPLIPERTTSTLGHMKSASTSVLRSPRKAGESPGTKKPISVSNPAPSFTTIDEQHDSPPKSPSRSYKGSPLKAAKDKFSSILKTSRGLFASSAAVSADAKSSALSPPSSRTELTAQPSFEDVLSQSNDRNPHYPNLESQHKDSHQSLYRLASPPKPSARKTRASTEKEEKRRDDEAREAKEVKEAQKMNDQLEKARMKSRDDARVFHLEQERVAAMQKEVAARKENERLATASQIEIPRATRSSPRKTKAQLEAEGIAAAVASSDELAGKDMEMSEAMPPPAIPRPKSQIGRPGVKRPLKPAVKEPATKGKPTVIRVDTGSQRGHHQHPSNSTLAASLQDSLASSQQNAPAQGLRHKASTSSIQSKASTNSFKSAASKALESAARKKEQVCTF